MTSIARQDLVRVGLDVNKISISAAVVRPGRDTTEVTNLMADDASVRKFFSHQGPPERLRVCYEAGPTGYDLQRKSAGMGTTRQVAAPSLTPKASGDRVKTDRRDAKRLARLYRAGELVMIRVPTPEEEAVRDLCRARSDMAADLTRARNRLGEFLLRHGEVWAGATNWTVQRRLWLAGRHFEDKALELTFSHYMAVLGEREADLEATTADLEPYYAQAPFENAVLGLSCYRGVDRLGALDIAAEGSATSAASPRQIRQGRTVRRFHRPRAWRALERWLGSPHGAHQDGQRPPAPPAVRVGLGLQASPGCWPVRRGRPLGPWPGPGPPSNASPAASGPSVRGRTWPAWSPPPWPESSPASSGPRWRPERPMASSTPVPMGRCHALRAASRPRCGTPPRWAPAKPSAHFVRLAHRAPCPRSSGLDPASGHGTRHSAKRWRTIASGKAKSQCWRSSFHLPASVAQSR